MGKKRAGQVSKSQAIRDYKGANPDLKPKRISEDLTAQGYDVSAAFVSTILSTAKKKGKTVKRSAPKSQSTSAPARSPGRPKKVASSDNLSVEELLRMKQAVADVGGIDAAKSAISALEQLMD